MKRIKTLQSQGRDYEQMLKDYFGKYLYGLNVTDTGLSVEVQVVYFDFKHVETVRRELAQIMPEVELVKVKRDYTTSAQIWAFGKLLEQETFRPGSVPVIYMQRGDAIVKATIHELVNSELNQIELEEGDIDYGENSELGLCCQEDRLVENSWD